MSPVNDSPNAPLNELSGYRYIWIQPCRTEQDSVKEPWQSPGPCLCPHLLPTSRFLQQKSPPPPPLLSTVQSLYSPQHPSLKSGRSHQGLALRYGSLARGGICQGHPACLCLCHHLRCMREFQHIIFGYKNSAEIGHFCISVYNAVCRVEAIL